MIWQTLHKMMSLIEFSFIWLAFKSRKHVAKLFLNFFLCVKTSFKNRPLPTKYFFFFFCFSWYWFSAKRRSPGNSSPNYRLTTRTTGLHVLTLVILALPPSSPWSRTTKDSSLVLKPQVLQSARVGHSHSWAPLLLTTTREASSPVKLTEISRQGPEQKTSHSNSGTSPVGKVTSLNTAENKRGN